jgi:hypothetical protein
VTTTPSAVETFTAGDDGLHEPTDSFYDNETFWFSFFIPERRMGAWLYAGVRQHPGITHGGMWLWNDNGSMAACDAPFFDQFSHLKAPTTRGPELMEFPTGFSIRVREPLMSYDLTYDDRNRMRADLRFEAVEPPVALLPGAPPYPKASHFDQIGRVTGTVVLDGERIDVDNYAMRDRSWGPRTERGYRRVGYSWAGSQALSLLTYSSPTPDGDPIHTGYLRQGGVLSRIASGTRRVLREPGGHLTSIELDVTDVTGRSLTAHGRPLSDMTLGPSTSICICTALAWTIDGQTVFGEDQDVWPNHEWQSRSRG